MTILPILYIMLCIPVLTFGYCGGKTELLQRNGSFKSQNFPSNYPDDCEETWVLQRINNDSQIILNFLSMDIEQNSDCRDDWVELKYDTVVERYCGEGITGPRILSNTNMEVRFHSDRDSRKKGFHATFVVTESDNCTNVMCNGGCCAGGIDYCTCKCVAGYTGSNCKTNIDECLSMPCKHNGTCTDGANNYTCSCEDGYSGVNCENDTDECESDPCQHNGACTDNLNSYTCTCEDGFSGVNCENDTDECEGDPCQHNGTCTDFVNSYTCTCVEGYSGVNCENDIDECEGDPCQHNGTCTDFVNSYQCTCAEGYSGVNCENDIDECEGDPCQHNGTCTDFVNSYTCTCAEGYSGVNCEKDIDECRGSPCQHQGTCIDKINNYECKCKLGYTGDRCESVITPRYQNKVCQCRAYKKVTANSDVVALKVLRNTTSKYARRLGCAKDDRVSSAVSGVSFPLVIFVIWVILLKLDIATHCLHNKIAPTKVVQRR